MAIHSRAGNHGPRVEGSILWNTKSLTYLKVALLAFLHSRKPHPFNSRQSVACIEVLVAVVVPAGHSVQTAMMPPAE
jgi:hypothetical protein